MRLAGPSTSTPSACDARIREVVAFLDQMEPHGRARGAEARLEAWEAELERRQAELDAREALLGPRLAAVGKDASGE